MRIISLLPSATEIICEIGLADQLVGVTHECDWPPLARDLPKVTHTHIPTDASSRSIDDLVRKELNNRTALYSLNLPLVESLKPDLIVTQALCDVCAVAESEVQAAACSLPGNPKVLNLEPTSLGDVFDSMLAVGRAAGQPIAADAAVGRLRQRIDAVCSRTAAMREPTSVVLLEWADPLFSSGHWNPKLVSLAGGRELLAKEGAKSRRMEWDELRSADPQALVIALCGFDVARSRKDLPILEALPGWKDLQCVRSQRVFVFDGSAYFSRPGPRLVEAVELLAHCLHPDQCPAPAGAIPAFNPYA